jgi:predicted TIM-barrel fold metal-dependent hydrolase
VSACQVNSLEATFQLSADPARLQQDIGLTDFMLPSAESVAEWQAVTGRSIDGMPDLLATMADYHERFSPQAAAVKLAIAYARPIGLSAVRAEPRPDVFRAWIGGEAVAADQARAIEDAVLDAGLGLAADHGLTVKVHTGLHVGNDRMDLAQVRDNVADVGRLAQRYPTTFTLMHMAYPYEGEVIAAAKHFTNVVADLCWAWIIDPLATRTFLKRYLVSAPASKVLCFGGDYIPVENVVGHAMLARRELARTLEELVAEGYLDAAAAADLVPDLMHGNAERIFYGRRRVPAARSG